MVSSLTEFATRLRSEKVQPFVQTEGSLREVHDAITDMMKQLANEPSVGLYFVQQHVHKAVPGMVSLKTQMADSTREVEYVTQDVKDALNSVKSMKEVGPAVIERMIKTLDSAQPRLASLRPPKREGHPQDSSTGTGKLSNSFLLNPSQKQNNSPISPTCLMEQNKHVPAFSPSSSVNAQTLLNTHLLKRMSSEQVPLEKHVSGQSTLAGDYSGYVRTTFDSALQKASSMAYVTRWNSNNKGSNLENTSSGGGQSLDIKSEASTGQSLDIKSEASTESYPDADAQNVLGTGYSNATILRKRVSEPSSGASTNKETVSMAKERQEVQDFSDPLMGKSRSLLGAREMSDYGKPGQYMRAVLGSARLTAENVSRGATKFLSPDGRKPVSASDNAVEGWGWLPVPSNPLRAFNKQPQTSEGVIVQEGSGDMVIVNEGSSRRSEEEIQQLLAIERASYEAFAAEKAAKLEEWLQDTEEDDKETEIA